jgi:tetratricopeptide (TPR) repeat protein
VSTLTYLNFDIQIERSGDGYVMFAESPSGEAVRMTFEPPFSDLELENFLLRAGPSRRGVRRVDSQEVEAAKQFGQRMFNSVFSADVRGALQSSLDEARRRTDAGRSRVGVRVRLRLTGAPELANIPWEYIYNSSLNRFLALSVETPLVRYMDLPERIRPVKVTPPLRIVVMIAGPRDYPRLDVQEEWDRLQVALADLRQAGLVELELLETPTLAALQRQLRRGDYHILHFIGHGGYDHHTQDGLLVLEDEEQRGRKVSGQDLGMLLHDHTSLRLVILNACEGARTGSDDPFAGVAQSLVQQGIPAVIAMQFEITDTAAITFAHEFYRALADSYPVDASLTEARKVMFAEARGNGLEWGTPVLYMRSPDGRIFDVQKRRVQDRGIQLTDPEPVNAESLPVAAPSTSGESRQATVAATSSAPEPIQASARVPEPVDEPTVVRGGATSETVVETGGASARRRSVGPVAAGLLLLLVLVAVAIWLVLSGGTKIGSSLSEPPSAEARSHLNAGKKALENNEYDEAIAEFTQAIKLKPDYAEAYFWRGSAYADNNGMYDEAILDFDEAIRLKPDYAEAYFEKGEVYAYRGETADAITQFTDAISYKIDYADAYFGRAEQYYKQREYDKAFQDFNETLALDPSRSGAYWGRGLIYYERKDYSNAITDFTSAVESYPEFVEAYLARGDAYKDLGERDKAIADFRKVLELSQDGRWRAHAEEQLRALGEQ